jgi:hypothetical protein
VGCCCQDDTLRCCTGFIRSRGLCVIEYGIQPPGTPGCGDSNFASLAILVKMTDLSFTEIESVIGSTTTTAVYTVPVSSAHQYYAVLVVCCADAEEVFSDCTWEFNGSSWVLVGKPSGCDCTAIPLAPTPSPPIGSRTHTPCESGPPE